MLRQLRDRLQLDETLFFALASRVWHAFSGPITIVLLIGSLNLSEQGVFYALIGIISIQTYFELGLLNVLISQSSHETAALKKSHQEAMDRDRAVEANPDWILRASRMRDLIRTAFRWFTGAAIFYTFSGLGFGWFTLSESTVKWQSQLLFMVPLTAITVSLSPAVAILEGSGKRNIVFRFRFFRLMIGSLVVWGALSLGLKLWALVLSTAVQSASVLYLIFIHEASFFRDFRHVQAPRSDFRWTHEVLPAQWRVALISSTFHLATQFFTIIVLKFHGDAAAGRLGMTLSITAAIQMIGMAWVQSKYPVISAHHGAGERAIAGTLWRRTAVISTSLLMLGFTAFTILVALMPLANMGIENRFIQPWQIIMISIGCLANHIVSIQGFYVIARKAKPLLGASLIGSLTTAVAVWTGGYYYSTSGVVTGYAAAMMLVLVPVHCWAYYQFRKRTDI